MLEKKYEPSSATSARLLIVYKGLIHKLEAAGVAGEALSWFRNYLSDRRQGVVLPGASSDWAYIRAGVPQGPILGPLLYPRHLCRGVYSFRLSVHMFVRSFVRSFVLPSVTWNLRQSFALKFLKWCISQQLLIRKLSYLDHSYPGGLAFTP